MSAPEKITVNRHNSWRDGYKTIVNDDDFGDIVFEDTHYIRQDIYEATLAELERQNTELRAALNEAAEVIGVTCCNESEAYAAKYREIANRGEIVIDVTFRAIAKDTK